MRALLLAFVGLLVLASASSEKKVVCYFGSWAVYRQGNGHFEISDIDPTLCTHLIYTFVGVEKSGDVKVLDPWQDLPDNYGKDGFGRFLKLREQSPGTKIMVAIGGWGEESVPYSRVTSDPATRRRLVDSIVAFVKKYGFDGFDIDWEYPNQRGGVPADRENYVHLVRELKERFSQEGLLLSAAVAAAESSASQSYNIREISKYLDFINLMAYDLHGVWEKKTGMNAPLYAGSWESGAEATLNVNAAVNYWLSQGAPAEKLVLGTPLYGRSFTLDDPSQNGVGAPASTAGPAGPYTQQPGMLGYNEICEKLKNENLQVQYQEEQRVPYAVGGNEWISFDNERSIEEKADLAKKLGLGGMMVWSIETDDFKGVCGEKYPLLKTINSAMRNGVPSEAAPAPSRYQEPQEPQYQQLQEPQEPQYQQPQEPHDPQYQQPQEPEQPSGSVCQQEGYVRDPQNPNAYYYCQYYNGEYITYEFACPQSLVYDESTGRCDYP